MFYEYVNILITIPKDNAVQDHAVGCDGIKYGRQEEIGTWDYHHASEISKLPIRNFGLIVYNYAWAQLPKTLIQRKLVIIQIYG